MKTTALLTKNNYRIDPNRIVEKVAGPNFSMMPLEYPQPASEISCPRCGGNNGYYISPDKAWACNEGPCLDWQIGKVGGYAAPIKQVKYNILDYGVPEQYAEVSVEDLSDDTSLLEAIKKFTTKPKGVLLLLGSNGTGKTHASCAAIEAYLATGKRDCRFMGASDLHKEWKLEMANGGTGFSTIQKYSEIEFLVLDDLGIHTPTEMFLDTLYMIIDKRALKGTLFTTNLNSMELREKFSEAIFSRLASGAIKKMIGRDRRLQREWA